MVIDKYKPFIGVHCETTAIGNVLLNSGIQLSESMIFGLSEGLDYEYLLPSEVKLPFPMIGGRIQSNSIIKNISKNLNCNLITNEFESDVDALNQLNLDVANNYVVILKLDCFFLHYFKKKYHFPSHFFAVYGIDSDVAYISECEKYGTLQTVPLKDLSLARASKVGFNPSNRLSYKLECKQPLNLNELIIPSIKRNALNFLEFRGKRIGIFGVNYTAQEILNWSKTMPQLFNKVSIIADLFEIGGTGGANFRALYSDFLTEALHYSNSSELRRAKEKFEYIVEQWKEVFFLLKRTSAEESYVFLNKAAKTLFQIAEEEKKAMSLLSKL